MSSKAAPKIVAVVLTHNRLALLKDCVEGLRKQTRRPDEIIIVNNDSRDGTNEWLAAQSDLTVIHQANLGTGGFHTGIKAAYQKGYDWIWCHDDDSYPLPDALESLTRCPYFEKEETGFLTSLVLWKDNSMHVMCVPGTVSGEKWLNRVLDERCCGLTSAPWTGMMFSRAAVAKVGYPIKEFFLWSDDSEYSSRISAHFRCYVVLDSKLIHQTKENAGADTQTDPYDTRSTKVRCYYRNAVAVTLLAHASLIRRLKRVAMFVYQELRRAKSWGRRFATMRYSLAGFWLYLKVRKLDLHQ
jgi:rhamnopyranosyl-N-acetylglucosaminyl-diphospho-decaprenol beta-1,3/1,4-galactofuranosyltransferase